MFRSGVRFARFADQGQVAPEVPERWGPPINPLRHRAVTVFYRDVTRASPMESIEKWAPGAGSEGGRARAGIEPISLRYASGRA